MILKNKQPYNAELYRKSDSIPLDREISIDQALQLVKAQGYRIMESTA
jgi:hypothetical protein